MLNEILLLIGLVILSGFFSGSEIAYVISNKLKIEIRARKRKLAARSAYYFVRKPNDFFSTILISNNIVNIAFASISAILLARLFGMDEWSILLISTAALLFFGELIPKYFASEFADSVVFITSVPLRGVMVILYPFVKLTSYLSSFLTRSNPQKEEQINYLFSKENIKSLVDESHQAGNVDKNESSIISKVIALGEQRVYEAMRPRTDIVGIEIHQEIEEALNLFIESGYSKLPVYEDNLDNIKGVIYAYDLFRDANVLQSLIKEAIFVPETKKSLEMLNEFLKKQISIAIVVDEFGGTAGIVTVEDIMEELFGEIKDEYDIDEDICRKIAPSTYLLSGKVEIDYINEKYKLNIPQGDYETLSGFISWHTGRIPLQGETVKLFNYNFLIARGTNKRVELVKLTLASAME
jgi:putative hemolysin